MADLMVTLGLDSEAFERELKRSTRIFSDRTQEMSRRTDVATRAMQRQWAEHERDQQRLWNGVAKWSARGLTAAGAALRMGQGALRDYAEQFPWAQRRLEDFNDSLADLRMGVGRDLVGAFDGLKPVVDWLDSVRTSVANILTDIAHLRSGAGAEIDELNRQQEQLDLNMRRIRTTRDQEAALKIIEARARGDTIGAAEIENDAAVADYRAQLEATKAYTAPEVDAMVARRDAAGDQEIERMRQEQRREAILERRRAEEERLNEQYAVEAWQQDIVRRREDFAAGEEDAESLIEIDRLRREGLEREADVLRLQMGLRREIRDLERNDLLTAPERRAAIERATDRSRRQIDLLSPAERFNYSPRDSGEVLGSGLSGNAAVRAVVFGGDGGGGEQRQQTTHLRTIADTLTRIERRPAGAVLT